MRSYSYVNHKKDKILVGGIINEEEIRHKK
ncbi:hypothetical protein J2Z26_000506 [Bacillus luteolus]|nr:hypothetical protein [Cytobacillus luteolus]